MMPLSKNDTFTFHCHPGVSCFNECCRDLNQFLYPYDILRLTRHLKMHSNLFLNRYTSHHTGPSTGLPMVTLRPLPGKRRVCPFVSDAGCRVYPDRPASCRIYPLARAIARNRQTGQTHEQFARLQESHCRGHANKKTWTAGQWMANQQLEEYNRINDRMMTLIRLKNQQHSGPLRPAAARMFFMACYDLDTFREQVLNHGLNDGLMDGQALSPRVQEQIASDDLFLIEFGMDWIKSILATS